MRIIYLLAIIFLLSSCDNDVYITYHKEKEFTISKLKTRGKRNMRGFYVKGVDQKVRYRNIRNGKLQVGDKICLQYDSIVNNTKGTYEIKLQRRFTD